MTSECILPFLENALADSEERVVAQSVRCITALVQLRLLSRLMTVDAVKSAAPLLLHPRSTIRSASLSLVDAAAAALGLTDSAVFLLPLLRPALAYNLTGVLLTSETVSKALIEPLSWRAFRRTLGTRQMALIGSLYSPKNAPSRKEGKGNPSQTTIGDKERDDEERLQRDKSKEGNDITQKNMGNSWVVSSSSREINSFEYENDEDDMVDNDYESENDEDLWCEQSTPSSTVQNSGASSPPKKNEINNYVDQDTSGGQTQATMPFEDAAEPLKLQYVSDYIDLAARESLSRATQGHWHGDITGGQVLGNSSFQVRIFESDSEILHSRGESLSLALSQVTQTPSAAATGLSEHLAHSLLVPNQIYDSGSACSIPSSSSATNPATTSTSQRSSPFLSESDRDMAASILFGTDPEKVAKGVSRSALHAIFGVQVGDLRSDVINGFIRRGDPISLLSHTGKRNAIDTSLPYSAPSSSYVDSSGVASYIRSSGHMEEGGLSSVPSASITVKEETGKEADDIVDKMKESDRENDRDRDRERTGAVAPSSLDDTSGQRASTLSLIGWLRALKIPPLPPDLGSLQHSDGTPYR